MKNSRFYHLRSKYGITEEQYDTLLSNQEGLCAVCGKSPAANRRRLAVDHNHRTGEIRGLLCFFCNKYLVGRHTDGRLLKLAAAYLDKPYTGWFVPEKKKRRRKRTR